MCSSGASLIAFLCCVHLSTVPVHAIPITLFDEGTPVLDEVLVKFSRDSEGKHEFHRLRADYGVATAWGRRVEGFSSEMQLEFVDYVKYGVGIQYAFGKLSKDDLEAVQKLPGVEALYFNKLYTLYEAEQNEVVGSENASSWGLDRVDQRSLPLDQSYSWNVDVRDSNVEIIIIDSGVVADHPDWLPGQVEFLADCSFIEGKCRYDMDPGDPIGHGTHVAGTAASPTYGVAKGAKVLNINIANEDSRGGVASTVALVSGVVEAVRHARARPHKRFVVNMSWGVIQQDILIENAVAEAVAAGLVMVAAAGNDGQDACRITPARVPQAITVGASEISDTPALFSSHGSCLDIFAPGVDILSLNSEFENENASLAVNNTGTSMAAPHVCGAAALVLARQPYLTPAEVADELKRTATEGALNLTLRADSPNLLLYTLEFAAPAWPSTNESTPAPHLAACRAQPGVGHQLGPRGAYKTLNAFDVSACCDVCTDDWQCRAFTLFEGRCYLFSQDLKDGIPCPNCFQGTVEAATNQPCPCIESCGYAFSDPQVPNFALPGSGAAHTVLNPDNPIVFADGSPTQFDSNSFDDDSDDSSDDDDSGDDSDSDDSDSDDDDSHSDDDDLDALRCNTRATAYLNDNLEWITTVRTANGDMKPIDSFFTSGSDAFMTRGIQPIDHDAYQTQISGRLLKTDMICNNGQAGCVYFTIDAENFECPCSHNLRSPSPTPVPTESPPPIADTLTCGSTRFGNNQFAENYVGYPSGDVVYDIELVEPTFFALTTCESATNFDTAVRLFADLRLEIQIGENDDKPEHTNALGCSQVEVELPPGTYYAVVEGGSSDEALTGDFAISMMCGLEIIDFPELSCGVEVHTTNVDAPNYSFEGSGEVTWKLRVGPDDAGEYGFDVRNDFEALAYLLHPNRSSVISRDQLPHSSTCPVASSRTLKHVLSEGEYFFMIEGDSFFEGDISVRMICPGENNNTTAAPVEVLQASCGDYIEGTTCGAPDLVQQENFPGGTCAGDVVVAVTTPSGAMYNDGVNFEASTCNGSNYAAYLILYPSLDFENYITFSNEFCGLQSRMSASLAPNTTYYIVVTGLICREGSFRLTIDCSQPPPATPAPTLPPGSCEGNCGGNPHGCWCDSRCSSAGDCCDDFQEFCPHLDPGNTTAAPVEVLQASCGDYIEGTTSRAPDLVQTDSFPGTCAGDVVVAVTTPSGAMYNDGVNFEAETCNGSDYDTYLILYPSLDFQDHIAYNDDSCGTRSQISANLAPNTTYYIVVTGYSCSEGTFGLKIDCSEPPAATPVPSLVPTPFLVPEPSSPGGSCEGNCGGDGGGCYCDSQCSSIGDCCDDFQEFCPHLGTDIPTPAVSTPAGFPAPAPAPDGVVAII